MSARNFPGNGCVLIGVRIDEVLDTGIGNRRASLHRMSQSEDLRTRTYSAPKSSEGELGPNSGGQSGDTQGLSGVEDSNSESVQELLEEGQYFEAEVVSGIENAPDADESELYTSEVLADDVPREYDINETDVSSEDPEKD